MPFKVLLTNDAARDLDELYDYIAKAILKAAGGI
jgi:plasmid stabilization system protein ParE